MDIEERLPKFAPPIIKRNADNVNREREEDALVTKILRGTVEVCLGIFCAFIATSIVWIPFLLVFYNSLVKEN